MFTGLVASTGTVRAAERDADGMTLAVETALATEVDSGGSVAVSGVCLTATEAGAEELRFTVMGETLRHSALGGLAPGAHVNLELPLRAGDPLGGHVVQGHSDGVGTVESVTPEGVARLLRVEAPPEVLRYLVERGSVAVDGVSLTVAEVGDESFTISLVPETVARTTLGDLRPGDPVTIEVDVLAKYVEKLAVHA